MTIVRAEPLFSAGAVAATNAENCGESAAALSPQIIRKQIKIKFIDVNMNDEIKQQVQEMASATKATRALPIVFDSHPPTTQPTAPAEMAIKLMSGILI